MTREQIIYKLIEKKITVATAESCTGGLVSAVFTAVAGVSEIFIEGAVTYANEAKIRLGVKEETIKKYGAVSEQTAKEMAEAVRKRAGAKLGISTTGIAGPTGGSAEKPVGLVYIGISYNGETYAVKNNFDDDRDVVRHLTVSKVFELIESIL